MLCVCVVCVCGDVWCVCGGCGCGEGDDCVLCVGCCVCGCVIVWWM